ncbi:hypothetical protein BJY21_002646 [Kineosphaera limosa]|uniref:Methylamine utilisation protein MauE domain-containing protein n=1 Tax=Kineosphaera limosa NBRC 100340 TaxID=1184609 RepID=K6WSY4_9MICO|nr:MauE/DoxX family redox-associated membrane protein [Kineosphaera limosa]NYE01462.1 hypothetical protein [Kineosphaera limosa]GAB95207.1 hypothetical protein KILIM_017_00520 [Kineosphaera limosa NBRC 100340]
MANILKGMPGILAAPFIAAAILLAISAAPKLMDPMPLVRALHSVNIPANRTLVRLFATVQFGIFAAAIIAPSRWPAAALCCIYVGFSAFVWIALRQGGVMQSCGCFGKADTPPTRSHLLVTLGLAAAAGAVAVQPSLAAVARDPVVIAVTWVGAALVAFLAWQVFSALPATTPAAIRSIHTHANRST